MEQELRMMDFNNTETRDIRIVLFISGSDEG